MTSHPHRRSNYLWPDPEHTAVMPEAEVERLRRKKLELTLFTWGSVAFGVVAVVVGLVFVVPAVTGSPIGQPFAGGPVSAVVGPTTPPEPSVGQSVSARKPVPPVAGQPLRLSIPSVGITNAVVGRMSVKAGGAVDPPTPRSAYWLANYGIAGPASTNTVYIAGHTCRGAHCSSVFSPLMDVAHNATTVHPGDQVIVGTPEGNYSYTITDTQLYDKVAVEQQSELWKAVPGRLVLVTCFQYLGGTSSQQNFVVYAQLNPAS